MMSISKRLNSSENDIDRFLNGSKSKVCPHSSAFQPYELEISNLFSLLELEQCIVKENIYPRRLSKQFQSKKECISDLKPFTATNMNKYSSTSKCEQDTQIINRNIILNMSKRKLKKCRFCNFKKRTCALSPSSCKAHKLNCSKCFKRGHFPQSMTCKSKLRPIHYKVFEKCLKSGHYPQSLNCKLRSRKKKVLDLDSVNANQLSTFLKVRNEEPGKVVKANCLLFNTSEFESDNFIFHDTVCQLDGNDDCSSLSSMDEILPVKEIYAVNCESRELVDLINFVRSFNLLWVSTQEHLLCALDQSCFFCNIRSSCLRLRQERKKGPRSIKVNEFVCQLRQYGPDWRLCAADTNIFIEKTLSLIVSSCVSISSKFLKVKEEQYLISLDVDDNGGRHLHN